LNCREIGFAESGRDGWGLVAIEEFEGGVESVGVLARVMGKFYEGEEVEPSFRVDRTKDG
jgi:hypothetical protein